MRRSDDPIAHYDRVTAAWRLLLGEEFHYGYFRDPGQSLAEATNNLTQLMAERAAIKPGMAVLDVGCGIGKPACFLVERYACRVVGITTSEVGLAEARERARDRGLGERVTFKLADGMDNGLPSASFDRVWVLESSHLMPRKDRLLAECARVMRPGSKLALCDIILRRDLPMTEVMRRAKAFRLLNLTFGRSKMETLATYRRFAEQVGLQVEVLDDLSDATIYTFREWRRNLNANRDRAAALLGKGAADSFEASCEILATFWRERILGYGLVVASKS